MSPPATSVIPTTSLRMSEHSMPPPYGPSNKIHAARDPLPSIPESQARTARGVRRWTTGAGGGGGAGATPRWERR
ncbi:MAG: hypothetical protein DMD99_14075 [Candidatus Rokuibacteriota bacterium]|nr:MAG: hypothetical protein DMD99_14075 [Candidatus Rokubacteria bacterium]